MSLIQKKDEEHEYIEGVEIIGNEDNPRDIDTATVDLIGGPSAEDIAAGTARASETTIDATEEEPSAPQDDGAAETEQVEEDISVAEGDTAPAADAAADEPDAESDEAKETQTEDVAVEKLVASDGSKDTPQKPRTALIAAVVVVLVIVAAIVGYAFGSGALGGTKGLASATLTEDQLDDTVATYTYNGATHDVTAREAIESQYSLDSVKSDDDTYAAPSAETTLAYVRSQILLADAESRGIETTDDEISDYAESTLGSSDFENIASTYSLTEDQAKEVTRQSLMISKLQEQIVPDIANLTAPTQPTTAAEGSEDTPTAEYGAYIVGLLGDEWDADNNTWASTDGPFYQALGSESFSADSATYNQAVTAYYVAYQQYQSSMSDLQATWTEYANSLYNKCNITVYGLYQ